MYLVKLPRGLTVTRFYTTVHALLLADTENYYRIRCLDTGEILNWPFRIELVGILT